MNNWSGLDFFLFLIFFVNAALGLSRGATKEIISLMCVSVGLIFTIKFALPIAIFLNKSPLIQSVLQAQWVKNFMEIIGAPPLTEEMLNQLAYCISILICFVGAYSVSEAVLSYTGINESFPFTYATWNRKVGASLGCVRGYIFNVILILIVTQHLFIKAGDNSFFVGLFKGTAQKLDAYIITQDVDKYKELFKDKNLYRSEDVFKAVSQ
jgi:hypothetical protein